jgi:hypothetical protein
MVNPATRAFSTYLELEKMIKRNTFVVRPRSRRSVADPSFNPVVVVQIPNLLSVHPRVNNQMDQTT